MLCFAGRVDVLVKMRVAFTQPTRKQPVDVGVYRGGFEFTATLKDNFKDSCHQVRPSTTHNLALFGGVLQTILCNASH